METHARDEKTARIATLNDLCRMTLGRVLGRCVVTQGVAALPSTAQLAVLDEVQRFDAFTPANDPHGERDVLRHLSGAPHVPQHGHRHPEDRFLVALDQAVQRHLESARVDECVKVVSHGPMRPSSPSSDCRGVQPPTLPASIRIGDTA
jgi:Protein of unknown function (DUF3768)